MGSGSHCMSYKILQFELCKTVVFSLKDNPHCSMEFFLGVPQADSFYNKISKHNFCIFNYVFCFIPCICQ